MVFLADKSPIFTVTLFFGLMKQRVFAQQVMKSMNHESREHMALVTSRACPEPRSVENAKVGDLDQSIIDLNTPFLLEENGSRRLLAAHCRSYHLDHQGGSKENNSKEIPGLLGSLCNPTITETGPSMCSKLRFI